MIAGIILLYALPFQFSFCNKNTVFSDRACSTTLNNDANNVCVSFKSEIDKIINPLINEGKSVGISVGIVYEKNTAVFGYGKIELNRNIQPNGDTIYEIGSITKVFTALLLADIAKDGLINLTDPVKKFLPSSVHVPTHDNTELTLIDLASHLSGLPRIPSNLVRLNDYLSLAVLKNPYANYTSQQLYTFLSRCTLKNEPNTTYSYSNLGMGLLGHALSQNQKMSFEDMVVKRICNPLHMKDTRISVSPKQ